MMSKKKLARLQKEKEQKELLQKKDLDRLLKSKLGSNPYKNSIAKVDLKKPDNIFLAEWEEHKNKYKSAPINGFNTVQLPVRYEGEMLERELEAQRQTEILKARTAPAYNKGGIQLITDGMHSDIVESRKMGVRKV